MIRFYAASCNKLVRHRITIQGSKGSVSFLRFLPVNHANTLAFSHAAARCGDQRGYKRMMIGVKQVLALFFRDP